MFTMHLKCSKSLIKLLLGHKCQVPTSKVLCAQDNFCFESDHLRRTKEILYAYHRIAQH